MLHILCSSQQTNTKFRLKTSALFAHKKKLRENFLVKTETDIAWNIYFPLWFLFIFKYKIGVS